MASANPENIPSWDLSDFYSGPDAPEIDADLGKVSDKATGFEKSFQGRVAELSPTAFAEAIIDFESLTQDMHRIGSYAQLLYAADVSNPDTARFYQSIHERITDISTHVLFFTLEINRLDEEAFTNLIADSAVAHYGPWLRDVRAFRDHELSDELEQLLHQKSVTGRSSWSRLFDETMADMRIDLDGEQLTLSDTLNRLSSTDGAVRKAAAKALGQHLSGQVRLFSLITNTLSKDKEIEDRWRSYAAPMSSRNLENQVEDDVVEALVSAVKDAYPRLSHRYYALKAKWFGVDQLDYWDRNAPLPDQADRTYSWEDARSTVLDAYGGFDPQMAEIAFTFFDKRWIDAPPRPGKDSGAFSHPTVPSVHPYILMNFHGKSRDVMTLAHELGHGVHQVLAAPQGTLMCDTPLTLAETASVFGEMLTFQSMLATLDGDKDANLCRIMIAGKVEDMMNTVVRQVAFHEFERLVHDERQNGELTAERLGDIWMQIQTDSLGPALRFDDDYRNYWAYIPHFIHSPFYVYAYAFGDCLVNSLYDVFDGGHPGFQAKYLDMLKAGGTLRHKELLAPFGLDASDPQFWGRGLSVISRMIDDLEGMD
ncbi:MAG: M3 family oligoendopeptidase [Rhodospirillales bacterium]|nr:M3 family oligoendopeptidase [Rhodospirillales bacterium]MBT4039470.1 M3 family oligoendopeptidase [Rhodospirillales bacterium]MBT4627108.1 M3 family oligoendopeptidase [Rhodospirillales bacterium]MBT5521772.1 M3 family oligoendopeptidase [Rhodospirillales bacterium]MBT6108783.1 M3 family oligoendopeptidase [Rhodospirillales bacterium]